MEIQKGEGISGFQPYFEIQHNSDGRIISCMRRSHFTPKGNALVLN
jgi:hypothetical protein